jgi:hypothetical protein
MVEITRYDQHDPGRVPLQAFSRPGRRLLDPSVFHWWESARRHRAGSAGTPARSAGWGSRPCRAAHGGIPVLLPLLVLLLLPRAAGAGGSVSVSDLLPLLRRKPQLSGLLFHAYALPDSAFAVVRVGAHFRHLGGRRLGPYILRAPSTLPGVNGEALITLCTEATFRTPTGEPIPQDGDEYFLATDVTETITAIVIRDGSATAEASVCP